MIDKTFPIAEKLLDNGSNLAQNLYRQLLAEQDILKRSQAGPALDEITQQKQRLVDELNRFVKQLGQILAGERLPNSPDGVHTYLAAAAKLGLNVERATEHWRQIVDAGEKSRALNEQNGAGIDLLLKHTRQSLDIIKGKSRTIHSYGPDGAAKSDFLSGMSISV
ncbi:MAG: flagella synthesis protein FlgN [Gammaproteobacteria bacterium]